MLTCRGLTAHRPRLPAGHPGMAGEPDPRQRPAAHPSPGQQLSPQQCAALPPTRYAPYSTMKPPHQHHHPPWRCLIPIPSADPPWGSGQSPFWSRGLPIPGPQPPFSLQRPTRQSSTYIRSLRSIGRKVSGGVCPMGWGTPGRCLTPLPVPHRAPSRRPPREASHRGLDHRILQVPGGAAPGPQPACQDRDRLLAVPPIPGRRG